MAKDLSPVSPVDLRGEGGTDSYKEILATAVSSHPSFRESCLLRNAGMGKAQICILLSACQVISCQFIFLASCD